jgi:hypothetical protein
MIAIIAVLSSLSSPATCHELAVTISDLLTSRCSPARWAHRHFDNGRLSKSWREVIFLLTVMDSLFDPSLPSRAATIFWTNLAVVPVEILFDAIQIELERRGVKP